MNHYLIMYRPPRSTFVDDATVDEMAAVANHFEYLKGLLNRGTLLLAGRIDDARFGIAVVTADNEIQARSIMENDPAVRADVFSGELLPFRLALMAGTGGD